jgi:quercetin dioxygenase-like cupin family protein
MAELANIEVGQKLHAVHRDDGQFYPAEVVAVAKDGKRSKAPVQVTYNGYEGKAWVSLAQLKSKKLGLTGKEPQPDFSGLTKGLRMQVKADDGKFYAAEVVTVSKNKKSSAPVKVSWVGYTSASDEWVGADRIRSKVLTAKPKAAAKAEAPPAEPKPQTVLQFDQLEKAENAIYNPEWVPGGDEGGVDTNTLPWIDMPQMGCQMKPLQVKKESGAFTILIKLKKGTTMPDHVTLGAQDMFILSGELQYTKGPLSEGECKGKVGPGVWGYCPANARMEGAKANEDTEFLTTYYGAVAFFKAGTTSCTLLTAMDIMAAATKANITMLPCTLKDALTEKKKLTPAAGEPLNVPDFKALCSRPNTAVADKLLNPHFVDTNSLPWIGDPPIQLKVVRVSAETGTVSMIVKQNGQAPPHYHLGPADFFITEGRIGYRAGPPEGYGPGTYMYEPAGARHESTQPVETDLIYTANVYGPIQFDSGVGTPVVMVLSWMTYLQMAQASNSPLLASNFPDDSSLLAPSIK